VGSDQHVDSRSDLEIVAAINAGEPTGFDALYFRYRDWVAGLAARFTGDEDLALDVMQETFLYVLRKFPGFRLTANMKTFLYPAVKNLSIAARRKAARYEAGEGGQHALNQAAAPPDLMEHSGDLEAVVAGLSEDHRETLLLRFMDGLSLAEIALATEVPPGTVKSRLHHALNQLRQDPRIREFFDR
jgi:RNA polymerase sigma-70 factor (ECF subfamily)